MARIHLFEWEDQKWFPTLLRDFGTDFLGFLSEKTKMFEPIVPKLVAVVKQSKHPAIVDLGSGGGGGLVAVYPQLRKELPDLDVTLTDLHPNNEAMRRIQGDHPHIGSHDGSVDARDVPEELEGVRTMFLSFHHFRPQDAKAILQDAVNKGRPIAIFEGQERSVPSIIAMIFSPITVLLMTPMIRPFRLSRLLFTYLIPIVPLFVLWDGVVSSLRTYSVKEMNSLIEELDNGSSFSWEVGKVKSGPGKLLFLTGMPK